MFRNKTHILYTYIFIALLALLLPACNVIKNVPATASTAILAETAGATPASSAAPAIGAVTVDASDLAHEITSQEVEARPGDQDGPWWAAVPLHTELTLQGYPVVNHRLQPQILVYPVKDLGVNDVAVQQSENLQALLQSQLASESMPFLPLQASSKQMAQARVKYLDFKSGRGVRYLTQYANGLVPFNNQELVYSFQSLTADGQYYVAAVLPVNLPGLASASLISDEEGQKLAVPFPKTLQGDNLTDQQIREYGSQYRGYLAGALNLLNQQPAGAYTPDLSKLDALVQSIEIK